MNAIVACQQAGEMPQGDPVILGVYLWSLVHGLAELWRNGPLSLMPQASDGLEPMARQVLMAALGSMEAAAEKDDGARGSPARRRNHNERPDSGCSPPGLHWTRPAKKGCAEPLALKRYSA